MDINEHPIHRDIYNLCREIEGLPASELQTKIVTMASALHNPASRLVSALKDAVSVFQDNPANVNEERLEAWKAAL
jgi:hypothetical protein